nr:hypothetical protein [Rickettsia endosymbiont of Ixodes scapularis]
MMNRKGEPVNDDRFLIDSHFITPQLIAEGSLVIHIVFIMLIMSII